MLTRHQRRMQSAKAADGETAAESDGKSAVMKSPIAQAIAACCSFEILFILYIWAGRYKATPELIWFPADFTLLFFAVSVGVGIILAYREVDTISKIQDAGFGLFVMFTIWVLVSVLWSSYRPENLDKLMRSFLLLSWSFLGPYLLISTSMVRVRRLMTGMAIFSVLLLMHWAYYRFLLGVELVDQDGVSITGSSYQNYSYHGLYLVLIFFGLTIASRNPVSAFGWAMAIVAMIVLMLVIGGRGPLLFAVVMPILGFMIMLAKDGSGERIGQLIKILFGFVLAVIILKVIADTMDPYLLESFTRELKTLERITSGLGESDGGRSVAARVNGQDFALSHWQQAPIVGWGIGEFWVLNGILRHPHNLVLEVLMELGLIGFWLMVGLIAMGVLRGWQIWPSGQAMDWAIIAVCMIFLAEVLSRIAFQGYLPEERLLFAMLGIILGLGRGRRLASSGEQSSGRKFANSRPSNVRPRGRRCQNLREGM